jgi:hypothetical protein
MVLPLRYRLQSSERFSANSTSPVTYLGQRRGRGGGGEVDSMRDDRKSTLEHLCCFYRIYYGSDEAGAHQKTLETEDM